MDSPTNVASVIAGLRNDAEQGRKLAAFSLQGLLADDKFAESFARHGGLPVLRRTLLDERGNTLAYGLGSFTQLLLLGLGWECVTDDVVGLAVDLVLSRPVVNVLRNALLLLVLVVSRPLDADHSPGRTRGTSYTSKSTGFKALKPFLQDYDTFLDCLVDKLGSADHALCGNALQLMTALLRDAITNESQNDWSRFVRHMQELGVVDGVEALMRGEAVGDLAEPLMHYQDLTKLLIKRWRDTEVELDNADHRKALGRIQAASFPPKTKRPKAVLLDKRGTRNGADVSVGEVDASWNRLGFGSEDPSEDFEHSGLLGLMDLTVYARGSTDEFQKALLDQSVMPAEQRCPIAKACVHVSLMLCEYFGINDTSLDLRSVNPADVDLTLQPLLLRWQSIHAATVNAMLRLWTAAGAMVDEFDKIEGLVRVLVSRVFTWAGRKKSLEDVEMEMSQTTLAMVRQWQLEELDKTYETAWAMDLKQIREQLHNEATQFIQEQRVRCLLDGAWFPVISAGPDEHDQVMADGHKAEAGHSVISWRFVRLASSRRYLHHITRATRTSERPEVNDMDERIDVQKITSVVSSQLSSSALTAAIGRAEAIGDERLTANGNSARGRDTAHQSISQSGSNGVKTATVTRLTIIGSGPKANGGRISNGLDTHGSQPSVHATTECISTISPSTTLGATTSMTTSSSSTTAAAAAAAAAALSTGEATQQQQAPENQLLSLDTSSSSTASEWLDGLLMLLDQRPITKDTNRLIDTIREWGLTARLLEIGPEDLDEVGGRGAAAVAAAAAAAGAGVGPVDGEAAADLDQWDSARQQREEQGDGSGERYVVTRPPVPSREGLDTDYWFKMGDS